MESRLEQTRRAAASHFWFRGFRRFMIPAIAAVTRGQTDLRLLDCGCGVGQNLDLLAPYGRPFGFEMEPDAAVAARDSGHPIARADITHIPFRSNTFDLAMSIDVMQCLPDDVAAVREMARVLKPGGRIILNVAALDVLYGDHSEIWNEYRRYTPASLKTLVESAGLRVERISFLFATLFPILLLVRTAQRLLRPLRAKPSESEIEKPWGPVNTVLTWMVSGEAALARRLPMPVGSSLLVIARKEA